MQLSFNVLLLFWFLDETLANEGCPNLNIERNYFNESDYMQNNFIPYRYYSSDSSIMSPFYIAEGSFIFIQKPHHENVRQLQNYCETDDDDGDDFLSNYLNLKYTLDDSGKKMNLTYETNTIFCDPEKLQLSEMIIFDMVPQRLLSLYGCQEVMKNGEKVKFEGILVLVTEDDDDLEDSADREYIKKTYDIITNQIGIQVDQLSKYKNDKTNETEKAFKCRDIQAKIKSCEGKLDKVESSKQ